MLSRTTCCFVHQHDLENADRDVSMEEYVLLPFVVPDPSQGPVIFINLNSNSGRIAKVHAFVLLDWWHGGESRDVGKITSQVGLYGRVIDMDTHIGATGEVDSSGRGVGLDGLSFTSGLLGVALLALHGRFMSLLDLPYRKLLGVSDMHHLLLSSSWSTLV